MRLLGKYLFPSLLGISLLVGVLLRFYNTPARYGLDPDATRDALITNFGAQTLQFPATGPISALGSFAFGPYYYYELILFRIITPTPYAPWVYMGLVSVVVIFIFYQIGKILEERWFGIILAGWAAVTPAQISPATGLSNPNLVMLHATIAILLFIYILKKNPAWWWALLLGLDLGLGINMHYQMVFYLVFPLFLLFSDRKKRFVYFSASILGLFLAFVPLLLFDFTHSFVNTQGLLQVLHGSGINRIPNSWKIYLKDFWPVFWSYVLGVPMLLGLAILVLAVISNIFLYIKKRLSKEYMLLILAFLIMFILLRFYPGERVVYYLYFLQPLILIFAGMVFYLPYKLELKRFKYAGIIISSLLFGYIFAITVPNYHTYDTRIDALRRVGDILKKYPNDKIAVYSCRNIEDYKSQGVAFLLLSMNKLGQDGKGVGMVIGECSDRVNIDTPQIDREVSDLSGKTSSSLVKNGWVQISPQKVYEHYAYWYRR